MGIVASASPCSDVNEMLADETVDAIISLRGGYGSVRLLPYLDYDLIQNKWKNRLTKIATGRAKGRLVGRNLTLVVDLLGTPYEPDFKNKILFLEDCG
ncbi:MAG: LD-carboxypeptidase, partial [Chloroflexota bacterium]